MSGYRTLIAAAVALIAGLLQLYGIELPDDDREKIVEVILALINIGGILAAIWFRVKATKRIVGGKLG